MFWLRKSVLIVLLALWLPATLHCGLELVPSLSFLRCGEHQDEKSHQTAGCDEDFCATVESGCYRVEDHPSVGVPPVPTVAAGGMDWLVEDLLPERPLLPVAQPSPPDLSRIWQFSYRAALPPRAPSFVS